MTDQMMNNDHDDTNLLENILNSLAFGIKE